MNGLTEEFRAAWETGDTAIMRAKSLAFVARGLALDLPGVSDEEQAVCVLLESIQREIAAIEAAHDRAWVAQGGSSLRKESGT